MGKLIVVVGNTGVGKTTLVQALCKQSHFVAAFEEHDKRPFQDVFKNDFRFALPNQIDYLLLRAEQERLLRQLPQTGLMDGGLEMDFYGFTQLFHSRAWLSDSEFQLCERLYKFVRTHQPPPELIINLTASPHEIARRLSIRNRINIAAPEDIPLLNSFLEDWLFSLTPDRVFNLDVSENDIGYHKLLPSLISKLRLFL